MSAVKIYLDLVFAGLGDMAATLGICGLLIVVNLFLAWFSPIDKKLFLALAALIAVGLTMEAIGIHQEHIRDLAQQRVIQQSVNSAVAHTQTPKAKSESDPWDRKQY